MGLTRPPRSPTRPQASRGRADGLKERRWCGVMPYLALRMMLAGAVALWRSKRSWDRSGRVRPSWRRARPWRRSTPPRSTGTWRHPARCSCGAGDVGGLLPSTSKQCGARDKRATASGHCPQRGIEDFSASMRSTSARRWRPRPWRRSPGRPRGDPPRRASWSRRWPSGMLLRSSTTAQPHRSRQLPATGLVDAAIGPPCNSSSIASSSKVAFMARITFPVRVTFASGRAVSKARMPPRRRWYSLLGDGARKDGFGYTALDGPNPPGCRLARASRWNSTLIGRSPGSVANRPAMSMPPSPGSRRSQRAVWISRRRSSGLSLGASQICA